MVGVCSSAPTAIGDNWLPPTAVGVYASGFLDDRLDPGPAAAFVLTLEVPGHRLEHGRDAAAKISGHLVPRVVSIVAEIRVQGPSLIVGTLGGGR
jgi:hypothetical protein